MTNDHASIHDATTLIARLEEHSIFANRVVRDLLCEAALRIRILTKERDFYEMKMTFYAKDAERIQRAYEDLQCEMQEPPREADPEFWLKERHSQ